jgi:hypothetical protein
MGLRPRKGNPRPENDVLRFAMRPAEIVRNHLFKQQYTAPFLESNTLPAGSASGNLCGRLRSATIKYKMHTYGSNFNLIFLLKYGIRVNLRVIQHFVPEAFSTSFFSIPYAIIQV